MNHTKQSMAVALEALLAERLEPLRQREQDVDQQGKRDVTNRPVLFGCGALGRIALAGLRRDGVEPLAFADNNPLAWGTTVDGLSVISLAESTNRFSRRTPIVVTIYTASTVEARLRAMGLNVMTFPQLAIRHPKSLLPYCTLDLPSNMCAHAARIREAFGLWADECSWQEYVAQIHFRYTLDCDLSPYSPADQIYFPLDLVTLKSDEVFVDCGAFDGDSVLAFLKRCGGWLKGVVAIEADPQNADRLRQSMARLPTEVASKVEVVQAAIGAKDGTIRFAASGTVASHTDAITGQETLEVPCRTLDDLLAGRNPSYIKMDIEGAEPSALEGCRQVIQEHAPVLAICLYHRQSDLWEIPLQIRQMTDRYSFFLRRYSDDCWEQVLYAIPHQRLMKS
jgi:FkbM family methyltransferase